jgi:hypothetical protein
MVIRRDRREAISGKDRDRASRRAAGTSGPEQGFDEERVTRLFINARAVARDNSSDFQKLLLTTHPNHFYIPGHPVPLRGAFRERHERGAGCGGRGGALDGRR